MLSSYESSPRSHETKGDHAKGQGLLAKTVISITMSFAYQKVREDRRIMFIGDNKFLELYVIYHNGYTQPHTYFSMNYKLYVMTEALDHTMVTQS